MEHKRSIGKSRWSRSWDAMLQGSKVKHIATNNLDKSKKEHSKALTDLRVYTCERRGACKADSARLHAKVEAILEHTHSPVQLSAAQRPVCSTHEEAHGTTAAVVQPPEASKWRKRAHGQYPAIDKLLARKQAISRLHGLGACAIISPRLKPEDKILHLKAPTQLFCRCASTRLHLHKSKQLFPDQRGTSDRPGSRHEVYAVVQPANSQDALPCAECDVSEMAQRQYMCFKAWRQQRQAAAVHIQKHARGLLARQSCMQLRRLNSHKKHVQHRVLSNCIQAWRGFASIQSRFRTRVRERSLRYGLWQHCHLEKQFDAEAAFSYEGKTVMAIQYRQWRMKSFVLTRWQMQTVKHGDPDMILD